MAFAALESYKPKPKRTVTEEQVFIEELKKEDLSSYGPVSKIVTNEMSPQRSPYKSPDKDIEPSSGYYVEIAPQNPNFIGNHGTKEEVEGAKEIYEGYNDLPGAKTLNEVKRRLTEMRKNKE